MVPSAGAITVLGLNGDRAQGLFPPYPTTGPCAMFFPLLAAFSSYLLLIGPARAQVSAPSCSDSSFNWVGFPSPRRSFPSNNNQFFASSWRFYSRLIRSNKIPAWSRRTWRPCATMAVSTCTFGASCAILSACAVFAIPALLPQHSYTGPSGVDNGDICKCNTVVYNLISACDACQGESWIPCVDQLCFPQDSSQLTYLFNQLLYVVVQLHNQSNSRNVSSHVVSTTSTHPQPSTPASRTRSQLVREYRGGPTSTHLYVCPLACLPKKFHQPVPLQIGDNWNVSAAQLIGGARETLLLCYTQTYSSCLLVQILPRLREPLP